MVMRKLVVAIDCDDVLVRGTGQLLSIYNRTYGTQVKIEDAHTANLPDWGAPNEIVHQRFDQIQLSSEYAEVAPDSLTIEVVRRLARKFELHVVTARPEAVMSVTEKMIETYFSGCFTSVIHLGKDGDKGITCNTLRADVIVDDNIRHIVRAYECGVMYRLWFGDYVWQRDTVSQDDFTARCKTWKEVEHELAIIAAR